MATEGKPKVNTPIAVKIDIFYNKQYKIFMNKKRDIINFRF
jgi:hypothetical protein